MNPNDYKKRSEKRHRRRKYHGRMKAAAAEGAHASAPINADVTPDLSHAAALPATVAPVAKPFGDLVTPSAWTQVGNDNFGLMGGWGPFRSKVNKTHLAQDGNNTSNVEAGLAIKNMNFYLGQQMFTPPMQGLSMINPGKYGMPGDNSFNYLGFSKVDAKAVGIGTLYSGIDLKAGITGGAPGMDSQNFIHHLLTAPLNVNQGASVAPTGFGFAGTYNAAYKINVANAGLFSADVIPMGAVSAGNVGVYAQAGGRIRLGYNMDDGIGGSDARWNTMKFNSEMPYGLGAELHAGIDARAVAFDTMIVGPKAAPFVSRAEVGGGVAYRFQNGWRAGAEVSYDLAQSPWIAPASAPASVKQLNREPLSVGTYKFTLISPGF
jgi:hypothetical protein